MWSISRLDITMILKQASWIKLCLAYLCNISYIWDTFLQTWQCHESKFLQHILSQNFIIDNGNKHGMDDIYIILFEMYCTVLILSHPIDLKVGNGICLYNS